MDRDDVYNNLCIYDARNPNGWYLDDEVRPEPCSCDNCFYGRNKLALEILRLLGGTGRFIAREGATL